MVVKHNRKGQQFEADVAGGVARISYSENDGVITFHHTEVPPESAGQGIAQALARTALQYARDRKLRVVPECGYLSSFMKRHHEYDDILVPDSR